MKRAILFLCIGLFIAFVIQPNLTDASENKEVKVPEREVSALQTNDDLLADYSESKAKICIDPALGGSETGYTSGGQMAEKDLNLALAKAIGEKLQVAGYEVVYTREDDNVETYDSEDITAQKRLQMATLMEADYLISVQMSSSSNPLVNGFSIFTQPSDNIRSIAQTIADNLSDLNFSSFEGLDDDHYANFPILNDQSMPSIIIDFGYMSNTNDYTRLSDETYQEKIGQAIAKAFLEQIH
jgi:N-acetylmuramoyl-L-alanine amidase